MGEARMKALAQAAGAAAAHNAKKTAVPLPNVAVCLQLDIATLVLEGVANQLATVLNAPGPAEEVVRARERLRAFRHRYLADAAGKVVLATPADVPPPKVQL